MTAASAQISTALERWLAPLAGPRLAPAYLLLGDNRFLQDRFRQRLLARWLPEEQRAYGWFDEDLAREPLDAILDRARNRSLMAPVQIFYLRNAKELLGRGGSSPGSEGDARPRGAKRHGNFPDNLADYLRDPNPGATLVLVADHLHLPADRRRLGFEDKTKLARMEETLGGLCTVLECGQWNPADCSGVVAELAAEAGAEIGKDAIDSLLELFDGDLGLIAPEVEKLSLQARTGDGRARIAASLVRTSAAANRQRSLPDLRGAMAQKNRKLALETLAAIWREEGDAAAIPLVYQIARALKMALLVQEERILDRGDMYRRLPEGLKPATIMADSILLIGQRWSAEQMRQGLMQLNQIDADLRSSPIASELLFEQLVLQLI